MKNETKSSMFFHGLGGDGKAPSILNGIVPNLLHCPTLDYEMMQNNQYAIQMVIDYIENREITSLIGNSMGGFWAFRLGQILGFPTLLFNPAISEYTKSHNWFADMFDDLPVALYLNDRGVPPLTVVVSKDDDVVDTQETLNYLNDNNIDFDWIILDCDNHNIPLESMAYKIYDFMLKY